MKFGILVMMAVPFCAAQAVETALSAFEVATIKPADPDGKGRFIRMQSAHTLEVKNYTVNGLIAAAYDLNPRMISGGPKWLESDRYDIVALSPGDLRPNHDEQMAMLRKLLADRFRFGFHREKKEFSIYKLTLAKGGPKFAQSTSPADEASNVTSTLYPAASGGIDHAMMPAHNVTMQEFASVLQRAILDRPVADNTGLLGRYDFNLEWTPDDTQFGGQLPAGVPDTNKPGLIAAMEEQLGLRIQPAKGLVDVLVVEKIDRPSAN